MKKNIVKNTVFNWFKFRNETTEIIRKKIAEIKTVLNPLTIETYQKMFTKHTDGDKMDGMHSLSTCPTLNYLCILRSQTDGLICKHCYSITMNKRFKNLRAKLERNTYYLTQSIIDWDTIPYLNWFFFRLESFGDLQNKTQAINYINLILKNPHVKFAWWTKNPKFIADAFKDLAIEKPQNVQIIFSSPCMNKPIQIEILKKVYPFIDKVFTVFDRGYLADHPEISINCGSRHCIECQNCYRPDGNDLVNEVVK